VEWRDPVLADTLHPLRKESLYALQSPLGKGATSRLRLCDYSEGWWPRFAPCPWGANLGTTHWLASQIWGRNRVTMTPALAA
jgi:hypothetical protein